VELAFAVILLFFYKDILSFFLKLNLNTSMNKERMLFDVKAIVIILSLGMVFQRNYMYFLNENGQLLSYQEFQSKYDYRNSFLNFYKVINAIP